MSLRVPIYRDEAIPLKRGDCTPEAHLRLRRFAPRNDKMMSHFDP
jgi:hypothetical protein